MKGSAELCTFACETMKPTLIRCYVEDDLKRVNRDVQKHREKRAPFVSTQEVE
jgi:hypothetical protein